MRTALDSSVILDVLTNNKKWADASQQAITEAISLGSLVIGECVLAEITPALDRVVQQFVCKLPTSPNHS